jgi:hypothetical protein
VKVGVRNRVRNRVSVGVGVGVSRRIPYIEMLGLCDVECHVKM